MNEGEYLRQEGERLRRRILHLGRFRRERPEQVALLYRLADSYGRRVFPYSLCHGKISAYSGCETGECCQCRPDVFASEKRVLDLLPKKAENGGWCPFFNHRRRTCGIYGVRPFACRIYYNVAPSRHYCQSPAEETLRLFDAVKRHVEEFLGPHLGGYQVSPTTAWNCPLTDE